MRNMLDQLNYFINSFSFHIHVVVITETRLYKKKKKFFDIEDFIAYHSNKQKVNSFVNY